jgi:hypothetical protein
VQSDSDLWHFIYDELTGHWMWRRISAAGEEVAQSLFSFVSLQVCVADAEREGFNPHTMVVRRIRSSELESAPDIPRLERRRRPRNIGGEHVR